MKRFWRDLGRLPLWQEAVARVGAALLVPIVVVGGLVLVVPRFTDLPAGVVVQVDEVAITEQDLESRLHVLEALFGVQAPREEAALDGFRRETAELVATSTVLEQATAERGIVVADREAADLLTEFIGIRFGEGPQARDRFVQFLGQVRASEQDLLAELKIQGAASRLYDQLTADVPVPTDDEVRQWYDAHPEQTTVPEQRHLRNIVVPTREEADEVLALATGGADFAALAAKRSRDRSTRDKGGDLGLAQRAMLEQAYGDAAFAAAPGAYFGPVQTRFGWNAGQVLEVRPAVPQDFAAVAEGIRLRLHEERRLEVWNAFVAERKDAADIDYADRYRPTDEMGAAAQHAERAR